MDYLALFVIGTGIGAFLGYVLTRRLLEERMNGLVRELEGQAEQWSQRELAFENRIAEIRADAVDKLQTLREAAANQRKSLEAGAQRERATLQKQIEDYRKDEERMKHAFSALATQSLDTNTAKFLHQAQERLAPLLEHQKQLEKEIRELESKRQSAYELLREQTHALRNEAHQLNRLLASPPLRGSWGEFHLKKVVELAGLKEHVDFERQVSSEGVRPDMVVGLPGKREIVVDSKVPLTSFSEAINAQTDAERAAFVAEHVRAVRDRIAELSRKDYQSQFERLDFVVVFIPVEAAYYTALESDPDLVDFKTRHRVLLAGPVTLIALLRAVAFSWREVGMVENASKIGELAETLHQRLGVFSGHLDKVGSALTSSVKAYNKAIASFGSRLLPQVRNLEGYIRSEEDRTLDEPKEVDELVRSLGASEVGLVELAGNGEDSGVPEVDIRDESP